MKTCNICGQSKPHSDFAKNKRAKDGRQTRCRECFAEYNRQNPEGQRRRMRKWTLKHKYGITIEDYEQMLADQGGGCAICGTDTPGGGGTFHVDHCHESGKVRGVLCNNCNLGIGFLQEQLELFDIAKSYLRWTRS